MTELEQQIAAGVALAEAAALRPMIAYRPGRLEDLDGAPVPPEANGQLQFHSSQHVIRLLAPGNGWGKTATVAVEVDWVGFGDHPYDKDLPKYRPRMSLWLCQKHQQWEMMRGDIERWWSPLVVASWVGAPHYSYTWPDGSKLFIATSETDWLTLQGIQPDRVFVDESIPFDLWKELIKRRRGETRTRYAIAATATQGLDWTYSELYKPWKKYHEEHGISEEKAMMRAQIHRFDDPALADLPGIWCWPAGSHRENPTATRQTWAFYLKNTPGSDAERAVRLYGGYRNFAGSAVFAEHNLEIMRSMIQAGRTGAIEEIEA